MHLTFTNNQLISILGNGGDDYDSMDPILDASEDYFNAEEDTHDVQQMRNFNEQVALKGKTISMSSIHYVLVYIPQYVPNHLVMILFQIPKTLLRPRIRWARQM